ncbi:MAG: hypothetical protein KA004_14275 [Verrucomicrobiales bacterium]|nr:hypothetical protein [Verrucomicrobiales bacterium]
MRIPRKLLWLLLFACCTFLWVVFFQHGWEPEKFLSGIREEISRTLVWLGKSLGRTASP